MYLKLNNINLYYEKYGTRKQTIIILPGWGDTRKTFTYLINDLKDNFTIYIIDYPGFGNSKLDTNLTIFDYTDFIYHFIKTLNIYNPILIGHSFGGRIISILTTTYNIKIKKLLLIDVAGLKEYNIKVFIKKIIYKLIKKVIKLLPKNKQPKYYKLLFNKFASNDYKVLPNNLYKTFQNITSFNLKKYYQNITLETLILWGEFDYITPYKMGIKLNKLIPNSTIIKIKNTRHFPYLEKKYLVSKIIFEYLKKDII